MPMGQRSRTGFTLVEVMIVVGIIALLAMITIPNLLRARITANATTAQTSLRSISTALESYALANGQYPATTTPLIGQTPPYLTVDYFTGQHSGYLFTAVLAACAYTVTATPANNGQGLDTFAIATGGVLTTNP